MRSPFNWVGNKYRYIDSINNITARQKYSNVFDVFMGSGNILLNLTCECDKLTGNDIVPLLPKLYTNIKKENKEFTTGEIEEVMSDWGKFSKKEHYYNFREHWNHKYLSGMYDRTFIYETVLLLKMCSNSMVRFNRKHGYFNQGFRGVSKDSKGFFSNNTKNKIIQDLNSLRSKLQSNFEFTVEDFKSVLDKVGKDDLVILDPPYILSDKMYGTDFSSEDDLYILDFLRETEADFILFNYLKSGDRTHVELKKFIDENKDLYVETINEKNSTGQNQKGVNQIKEVMISNIKSWKGD